MSSDASDGLVPFGPPKSAFSFEFASQLQIQLLLPSCLAACLPSAPAFVV